MFEHFRVLVIKFILAHQMYKCTQITTEKIRPSFRKVSKDSELLRSAEPRTVPFLGNAQPTSIVVANTANLPSKIRLIWVSIPTFFKLETLASYTEKPNFFDNFFQNVSHFALTEVWLKWKILSEALKEQPTCRGGGCSSKVRSKFSLKIKHSYHAGHF